MSTYSVLTTDVTPALEQELCELAGNGGTVIVTESNGVTTYRPAIQPRLSLAKRPVLTLRKPVLLPRP